VANELSVRHTSGGAVYAVLMNATGRIYNTVTAGFETPQDANWSDYDITLAEAGTTGIYRGDMPSVAAGIYYVVAFVQSGGSPAVGDSDIGDGKIEWDGTTEITLSDKTGYRLSATGVDDILDEVVEGSYTLRQLVRIMASVLAGKAGGGGTTTITFTGVDGTTTRVMATVDVSGNRTAVTLDGT